jgi:hypothetical protein
MGPDGIVSPEQPGDKHCYIDFHFPADMAAHFGLYGYGGTRDRLKQFCTNCTCHLNHRHMPFKLIKVAAATTVRALAEEHDMPVNLLWACNAGVDLDGMFCPAELTEHVLRTRTLPLVAEAPAAVDNAAPSTVSAAPVADALQRGDAAFNTKNKKRTAKSASSTHEEAEIRGSVLRGVTTENPAEEQVPAGAVVRVVQTHAMTRRSTFVDQFLVLNNERCASVCWVRRGSAAI